MYMSKRIFVSFSIVIVILNACIGHGQSFKARLTEGKNDPEISRWSGGEVFYASSTQSLQSYKARLAEGKNDPEISRWSGGEIWYAASKNSLQYKTYFRIYIFVKQMFAVCPFRVMRKMTDIVFG